MKRKIAALTFALGAATLAYSGAHYPDICQVAGDTGSILCAGLGEHFQLGEASDAPRFGAGMSYLQEAPGINVAKDATYLAASFDGTATKWLWANMSAPGDSFTVAFRAKTATLGASGNIKYIMSWAQANIYGPVVYWYNNAGQGQFCVAAYEADAANTQRAVCQNAPTNTWNFVVVGSTPYVPGTTTGKLFISVNNSARSFSADYAYWLTPGGPYYRMGGLPTGGPSSNSYNAGGILPYDGAVSTLDFFVRPITAAEQTLLYNGSALPSGALTYPYDTN